MNTCRVQSDHITRLLASCYGTLAVIRKLKHLAPNNVREQLAESLVLSKLNYACTIFDPLPEYQTKRLQRMQNACAGFVLRTDAKESDIEPLGWLTVKQKSLSEPEFPAYLRLVLQTVATHHYDPQ